MGVGQEAQDTAMFRELEERLLRPDVRTSPEDITKLLADEFVEFGRSGRVFNKHHVTEALRDEQPEGLSPARTADGLTVRWLTKYNALVTYHTVSGISTTGEKRRTLRSSIWKRIDGRWQMIFHQGTPMGGSPESTRR
jgi:hypothetical protein